MTVINMRQMKKHQSGTIATVKAAGELGRRIREMGLVPGAEITIQGRAPLNDPVALRIMGGTLTLRNNEADYITLRFPRNRPGENNVEYHTAWHTTID